MVSRGGVASIAVHTGVLTALVLNRVPRGVPAPPVREPVLDPPVLVSTGGSASAGGRTGIAVRPAPRVPWSEKPPVSTEGIPPVRPGLRPVACDTACVRRLTGSPIDPMGPPTDGLTGPELEGAVLPEYPAALVGRGVSGRATIEFTVGADGRMVPGSEVTVGADDPLFARSAVAAAAAERFRPGRRGGADVPMRVRQTFVFNVR